MRNVMSWTTSRRRLIRGGLAFAGVGLTSALLAACGGQPVATPTGQGAAGRAQQTLSPTPKVGGTLTYAQSIPITTPDPINPQKYPAAYEANNTIYNNLVTFDPDLKIIPDLAEQWEVSSDNLTWTFHLRRGITFHDGPPFNAQAVEAHVRRIQDPKNASPNKNLWDHITGVNVVDDSTIQLITAKPFGPMLNYLAHGSGGIESPTAVAKDGAAYAQHPTGTGPYKLGVFNPGTDLTLVRNDAYFGGTPKLDKVVMRSVPDVGSRVQLLVAGQADLANDVPPENAGQLETGANTKLLRQSGLRTFWMEFNLNLDIFKDIKVRQALNYAVDKESLVKNLFLGYAKVLDSPAAATIQGYTACGSFPYDPTKAKQLLAEAGWKPGSDGVLQKNDVPMKFSINTPEGAYPKDLQVSEAVQANLKAVGCDVSIWKVDAASQWSYLRLPIAQAKYEMVFFGFNPSNGDLGYHLNSLFRANPDRTKAPYVWNLMWYANDQVDTLLNQADSTVDATKRFDLLGQAQKLIWNDVPMIWLYTPDLLVGASKNVESVFIWPTVFTIVRGAWKR